LIFALTCLAEEVKLANVAGSFYPDDPEELSKMIDEFLEKAKPQEFSGDIFALIEPHAGYGYSGQTAAYGYQLIRDKPYKTVIVLAPSHRYAFIGASVYSQGIFRTPLGDLEVDAQLAGALVDKEKDIAFVPEAFKEEHSLEVQLPFLQKTLANFQIVPIVLGDCTLQACENLAEALEKAIGKRRDVLVVASTDMYHGYDYEEADSMDKKTLDSLQKMDAAGLYYGLRDNAEQLCGGFGVVTTLLLAKKMGHNTLRVLYHTNSAEVTGKKKKGLWTVGYSSCAIDSSGEEKIAGQKGEREMLNQSQRKKLLELARNSITTYLKTQRKLEVTETDPLLEKEMGAFVTLHEHGQLRGCIGNLVGAQPLYLTIRDMAVEAATADPRFSPVVLSELPEIEIEISVLSPLQKISSPDEIELGKHGVLIRRGFRSGVFLPQVATETGWSKEEFLAQLCSHKAGLPADAWKDKSTEIYIYTAEVFSEEKY
jgi:AmmeMemoRadiSam system protein B/AmmeMemoRadiSam system protein A